MPDVQEAIAAAVAEADAAERAPMQAKLERIDRLKTLRLTLDGYVHAIEGVAAARHVLDGAERAASGYRKALQAQASGLWRDVGDPDGLPVALVGNLPEITPTSFSAEIATMRGALASHLAELTELEQWSASLPAAERAA